MPDYWFHHLHLMSPDGSKTAQFYQRMFNAKIVSSRELDLNGTRILIGQRAQPELAPNPPETSYGLEHFGLRTDDITAAVAELRASGVEIVQDVTELGRSGNLKIAFVRGPENVKIELLEVSG